VLDQHTSFPKRFVAAYDTLKQIPGDASLILDPQLKLVVDPGKDGRRYNLPTANEVMAILPDEWSDPSVRDVLLCHRNEDGTASESFTRVNRTHPAYLPLHYVLLFPHGTPGWHYGMVFHRNENATTTMEATDIVADIPEDADERREPDDDGNDDGGDNDGNGNGNNRRLTQRDWFRYHLFDRDDQFSAILRAGRLFEQFVDDAWASIDHEVLDWHRRNQDTVRAELYSGVMDALAGDFEPSRMGQPVILASSYRHGDRFMSKCYQVSSLYLQERSLLTPS
jgi:hypothetical protein